MPLKSGKLTPKERAFAHTMAETGDSVYSAKEAGYKFAEINSIRLRDNPAIQAEVIRYQQARLIEEALPAAVNCLVGLLTNDKAPAGARVQAAKIVLDRTMGSGEGENAKQPHEMTPDELQAAIDRLRKEASERAKPVIDAETSEEGVFD